MCEPDDDDPRAVEIPLCRRGLHQPGRARAACGTRAADRRSQSELLLRALPSAARRRGGPAESDVSVGRDNPTDVGDDDADEDDEDEIDLDDNHDDLEDDEDPDVNDIGDGLSEWSQSMKTIQQRAALTAPLIGREGERVIAWPDSPYTCALSFNR